MKVTPVGGWDMTRYLQSVQIQFVAAKSGRLVTSSSFYSKGLWLGVRDGRLKNPLLRHSPEEWLSAIQAVSVAVQLRPNPSVEATRNGNGQIRKEKDVMKYLIAILAVAAVLQASAFQWCQLVGSGGSKSSPPRILLLLVIIGESRATWSKAH